MKNNIYLAMYLYLLGSMAASQVSSRMAYSLKALGKQLSEVKFEAFVRCWLSNDIVLTVTENFSG